MRILHTFLFLILSAVCYAQQPATIKLTQLETSKTVEGTKAGQIGLTNTSGKQRYAQYTEIDLTPVGYVPSSTGNVANLSEFVIGSDTNIYYIDWQGRGLRLNLSGGTDRNGYYGGNGGNGGDNTIPSVTKSTLTNQLTFYRATDYAGGFVPVRIQVDAGNEPEFLSMKNVSDSLLFSRSDQEFQITSTTGLNLVADDVVALVGDSLQFTGVLTEIGTGQKTFLTIKPASDRVKKQLGINQEDLNFTPLTTTLANGKIWVGNASNVATAVTPSGDATMTNAGVITNVSANLNFNVGGILSASGITGASFGTSQNDLPVNRSKYILIPTAAIDITGINTFSISGGILYIFNGGSFPATFKNENTGSTAAYRLSIGSDFILNPGKTISFVYDNSTTRWRMFGYSQVNPTDTLAFSGATLSLSIKNDGIPAATATMPTFTSGAAGAVPASGGGTSNFLRADGTWASSGSATNIYNTNDALISDRFLSGASHVLYLGTTGSRLTTLSFNTTDQTFVSNSLGSYTGYAAQTVTKPWYLQALNDNGGVNAAYRLLFGGVYLGGRMNSRIDDLGRWQLFYTGNGNQERATQQWAVSEVAGSVNHYLRLDHFGRTCIDCPDVATGTTTSGGSGPDTVIYKFEVRGIPDNGASLSTAVGARIVGRSVVEGKFRVTDMDGSSPDSLVAKAADGQLLKIALGTNLSFSGNTLNAAGSGTTPTGNNGVSDNENSGNFRLGNRYMASPDAPFTMDRKLNVNGFVKYEGDLSDSTLFVTDGANDVISIGVAPTTTNKLTIKSNGNGTTTSALELLNSSGTSLMRVRSDGYAAIGTSPTTNWTLDLKSMVATTGYPLVTHSNAGKLLVYIGDDNSVNLGTTGFMKFGPATATNTSASNADGKSMLFYNANALTTAEYSFGVFSDVFSTYTSGTGGGFRVKTRFGPTSGSGAFNGILIDPTINQTSTASGDVLGITYDPILTSVLGNHYGLRIVPTTAKSGFGTATPTQMVHVVGNARVTGAYYDSNNDPGTSGQLLKSTATGTDWVDNTTPNGTTNADQLSYNPATSAYIAVPANRCTWTGPGSTVTPAESTTEIFASDATASTVNINYTPDSRFDSPFTTIRWIYNIGAGAATVQTNQSFSFRSMAGVDTSTFSLTAGQAAKIIWNSTAGVWYYKIM